MSGLVVFLVEPTELRKDLVVVDSDCDCPEDDEQSQPSWSKISQSYCVPVSYVSRLPHHQPGSVKFDSITIIEVTA